MTWAWVTPGAFLAAILLAGCGGGGGGGGSSSPPSNPPTTTPGAVALTATPGHGFVTLSWTQPSSASGTTYTIQRKTSGGTFENLPSTGGGSAVSVSGTTYQDGSYDALAGPVSNGAQNVSFPLVGTAYTYQVTASTGQVSNPATGTPFGPPVGISLNGPPPSTSPAPFTQSTSFVHFQYIVPASNPTHPVIKMQIHFDYAVTNTADVDRITLDVAGDNSASGAVVYSHSQIASGLTLNGNGHEIDFDSTSLGLSIPAATPYSLVLLNAYVTTADVGTTVPASPNTNAVTFQFCYYAPGVGNSVTLPEPGLSYASQFVYTLEDQVSGT